MRKRRQEFNDRPEAINQFGQCMQLAQKAVDSFKAGDEKFNHLDAAEVEKVQKAIAEKQDWFNRMCADVSKMVSFSFVIEWRFVFSLFSTTCYVQRKTSDFRALETQVYQERDLFWYMASNVLNKPKPKNR